MRILIRLIAVTLTAALLAGCAGSKAPASTPTATRTAAGYYQWTVADLAAALKQKDFTLVNVHIPHEADIAGTDLALAYDQISDLTNKLPADKGARIVLYCSSGRMSEIAAKTLVGKGYTNIVDVLGGMIAWKDAGHPLK